MNNHIDINVLQLLCSRICHDLVGPVGAINTAIELMADEGSGALDGEALSVLMKSAQDANRKLAFFRSVFGLGGGADVVVQQSHLVELTEGILASGKVTANWDVGIPATVSGSAGKIIMLLVFLAAETLPRGGEVTVRVQTFSDGMAAACIAEGEGAVIRPEVEAVLADKTPSTELSARGVPAYVLALLAHKCGATVEFSSPQPGQVALAVLFSDG